MLWDVKRIGDAANATALVVAAAQSLRLQIQHLEVTSVADFETAFKTAKEGRADAVLLVESPRAVVNRTLIGKLALKQRLPVMSQFSRLVEAGGLLSYGPDLSDLFGRAATYVDKILKGARPENLPIEQPTKFELVINMKTAKALGLTIPPSLLLRADQVIE
jgi:putative ABC transport system substrate-binding protein